MRRARARNLVFLLVLHACGVGLTAQAPPVSCCVMRIDPDRQHPGVLKITITNVGESAVSVRFRTEEQDYEAELTSDDGRAVGRTEHGKELVDPRFLKGGSCFRVKLGPGHSRLEKLDLCELFELRPGKYKVALQRDVGVGESVVTLSAMGSFAVP